MKKLILLLLSAVLLLGLTACGGEGDRQPAGGEDQEISQPVEDNRDEPVPPAPPDTPDTPDTPEGKGEEPVLPPESPSGSEDTDKTDTSGDEALHVSHTDVTLRYEGDNFRMTVWDVNGNAPDACEYTSANPEIAKVDAAGGEITAVAPGMTTITAHVTYNGKQLGFECIVRCVWDEDEPTLPSSGEANQMPTLEEFFTTLQGSYEGLDAMMVIEGELLDNYYPGLSSIAAVEEILVQETMMSTANVAVGLVKLSDTATLDDVLAVTNIFQNRITAQAEGGAFYPESCETWEKGVTTSVTKCVGMFVYPDNAQEMADLFTETFSN